jgi:phosphotransferase system HPr-like phosphotransfer protein
MVQVETEGEDEVEAMEALRMLVMDKFGEAE